MSNPSAVLEEMPAVAPETARILGGNRGRSDDKLPAWFREQQRAAWTQFQSLPMPAPNGSGLAFLQRQGARSRAVSSTAAAIVRGG